MRGTNWNLTFHIHTNAFDFVIRAILGQKEGNKEYAIYYINKNIQGEKLKFIVIEKEMLEVVHAINKFRHYIQGISVHIH